jgi:hypothetical protein
MVPLYCSGLRGIEIEFELVDLERSVPMAVRIKPNKCNVGGPQANALSSSQTE